MKAEVNSVVGVNVWWGFVIHKFIGKRGVYKPKTTVHNSHKDLQTTTILCNSALSLVIKLHQGVASLLHPLPSVLALAKQLLFAMNANHLLIHKSN